MRIHLLNNVVSTIIFKILQHQEIKVTSFHQFPLTKNFPRKIKTGQISIKRAELLNGYKKAHRSSKNYLISQQSSATKRWAAAAVPSKGLIIILTFQ